MIELIIAKSLSKYISFFNSLILSFNNYGKIHISSAAVVEDAE